MVTVIVEVLLEVGKELFGVITRRKEARSEDRSARILRIADYFTDLGRTIEETSESLKHGQYPAGQCQHLLVHAEQMEETIGDLVPNAKQYADKVKQVWQIEQLYGELSTLSDDDRRAKLRLLDEAAGYFHAIAAHLKVSPTS